ncbi:MAG: flagellar motor protein [Acidobacteria bacterium]|nr:flagellar motor protein [Acidobacteriota bacterium]
MADKAPQPAKSKGKVGKPDLATLSGLVLAVGGIVGGLILEGGKVQEILQPTAALIVFGGTIGAVMVTVPLHVFLGAGKRLMAVFFEKQETPQVVIEELIGYATKARKNGIVALEHEAEQVEDPFLRKALNLAVDGTDLQEIRKMMELEIGVDEHHHEAEAKVFEAAGGYAPTIGIIGAVLGLIQVMKHLADIEEVGHGIAVAFVATIYGVGSANILFLPAANKIRARAHQAMQIKELILEGIIGIVEGLNPKLIRTKLEAYARQNLPEGKKQKAKQAKGAPQAAPASTAQG